MAWMGGGAQLPSVSTLGEHSWIPLENILGAIGEHSWALSGSCAEALRQTEWESSLILGLYFYGYSTTKHLTSFNRNQF